MKLVKNKKGFTLVELVIVLAIAALIIAAILLAVSGAQKSRRDTQRKNDLSQMASALENYASNNSGAYPASQAAFNTAFTGPYANANWKDPLTGTTYTYNGIATPSGGTSAGVSYTLSGRVYNVCIGLEQGTQNCDTNQ